MKASEFDKFAIEYDNLVRTNVRVTGEGPEYFAEYKVADMRQEWDRQQNSDEPKSILDFGGGIGSSAPFLRSYFPESLITIADVSERSLEIAKARNVKDLSIMLFDGANLPIEDDSLDMTLAACVFHHIEKSEHNSLFREIRRTLKDNGSLMLFEHNPWNPLTVRAVNTCPFDENAVLINAKEMRNALLNAGFKNVEIRFRIFFPNFLRALRVTEPYLKSIPLGGQYCAIAKN